MAEILSPSDSSELVFIASIAATAAFSVLMSDFSFFLDLCEVFCFLLLPLLASFISYADAVSVSGICVETVLLTSCFMYSALAAASAALPEFIEASEGDLETVRETSPGPDSTDS